MKDEPLDDKLVNKSLSSLAKRFMALMLLSQMIVGCYSPFLFAAAENQLSQSFRYQGLLDVRVIEPNQAQYILGAKFRSGYSQFVDFKLRPYNGKATVEAYRPVYEDNNGDDKQAFQISHKYYISIWIREDNQQFFSAKVRLYRRKPKTQVTKNQIYRFDQQDFQLIEAQPIQGEFNQDNEYLFVDSGELHFYLKLNFDLIFTRQEVIERFQQTNSRKG